MRCSAFVSTRTMYSLQDALRCRTEQDIVIAEDITSAGQKKFLVGTVERLHEKYSTMQQRHWYECLIENTASRIFIDVESVTSDPNIQQIVEFFKQAVQLQFPTLGTIPIFEIMDSCSSNKFSWHVICTNVYLKNVYHVGAFVRKTVLAMQGAHGTDAIDTAVYTKNRMFRINGSTKFGSERVLTHTSAWYSLLVQSPCSDNVFECLEIDQSEPQSTSAAPSTLFHFDTDQQKWIRAGHQRSCAHHTKVETSCTLLRPIVEWLDRHKHANISRHKLSMTNRGQYMLPCASTDCGIAKRCHKGNNIWFIVDIQKQTVSQRCFDSDCASHSLPIAIDHSVWDNWNHAWQQLEPLTKPTHQ